MTKLSNYLIAYIKSFEFDYMSSGGKIEQKYFNFED